MNKLRVFFFRAWRPAILLLVLAAAAYLVFLNKLGTLLPGYSSGEVGTYHTVQHLKDIAAHPLNAPYKLLAYLALKLRPDHLIVLRAAAAAFGILASLIFFWVVRRWFTYRVALLATILFTTSGALIHVARLGSPLILQMAPLLLLATGMWFTATKHRALSFYAGVIVFATLLYIPGLVWFELVGLIFWRSAVKKELQGVSPIHKTLGALLALILLAPLIRAFVIFPKQLLSFAGLPQGLPAASDVASNLWHTLLGIGFHSHGSSQLWLGHAPLLDIVQAVLLIIGIYTYARYWHLSRSSFLLFGFLAGFILSILGGPVAFVIFVPFLYLLMAGGLYELLHEWFAVFPRNPIARFAGIAAVCVLVFFSVLYQWRAYFVAWPHNETTKTTFNLHS